MAKSLIIDGQDYSSYFTQAGYSVEYASVDGGQGGVMLNGDRVVDELMVKAVIKLPCMPLSDAQISRLLSQVYTGVYHTVRYYDSMRGVNRTISAIRDVSSQVYRGTGANGVEYWTGMVITFSEK